MGSFSGTVLSGVLSGVVLLGLPIGFRYLKKAIIRWLRDEVNPAIRDEVRRAVADELSNHEARLAALEAFRDGLSAGSILATMGENNHTKGGEDGGTLRPDSPSER